MRTHFYRLSPWRVSFGTFLCTSKEKWKENRIKKQAPNTLKGVWGF